MDIRIGQMRVSGLIAGVIVVALGALMMAEDVVGTVANTSFARARAQYSFAVSSGTHLRCFIFLTKPSARLVICLISYAQ